MKNYKEYSWATADDIVKNRNTKMLFGGWGETTLAAIIGNDDENVYRKAHELWLKLKDAFNKEAKHYDPETNTSRLGSIGDKNDREVMRSLWWDLLDGDKFGDYDELTHIIELLHGGEKLETGCISFGS